jgi:hypothetical protein
MLGTGDSGPASGSLAFLPVVTASGSVTIESGDIRRALAKSQLDLKIG